MSSVAACGRDSARALNDAQTAQAQFQAGQLGPAMRTVERAIKERDDIAEIHLLRGRIAYAGKDRIKAYDAYYNALALDATNREALQAVSQLGLQVGRLREAENAADRLLSVDPTNSEALLVKGLLRLAKRDSKTAIEFADKILATTPGHEAGTILKSRALVLQQKLSDAVALMTALQSTRGQTEPIMLTMLELDRLRGNAPGMLAAFDRLRTLKPDDFDLAIDEANLRYKLGQADAARALIVRAIGKHGGNIDAMERVDARWREYEGDPLPQAARATFAASAPALARTTLARFYVGRGRPSEALAVIGTTATPDAKGVAARARYASGDAASAAAAAEELLEKDATQCDALIVRAQARQAARDSRGAIEAAQKAAAECPRSEDTHLAHAAAYPLTPDFAESTKRAFAAGIRQMPQSSAIVAAYADWLLKRGETFRAVAIAQRLTRAAPAQLSSWRVLGTVCQRAAAPCAGEVAAGSAKARATLGIDLPTGQRPANGLYGRLNV